MKKFLVLFLLMLPIFVFAQTENEVDQSKPTREVQQILNRIGANKSQPVYSRASNLKTESSIDKNNPNLINISGSFTMTNQSSVPTGEMFYAVYGGLRGESYTIQFPEFSYERIGPIVLKAGETKEFNFSFQTTNRLQYGEIATEIRVETKKGTLIDKTTEKINLDPIRKFGKLSEPKIPNAYFEVNGQKMGILQSPIIYQNEDEASLEIEIPPLNLAMIVTPKLIIHKDTYFSETIREISFPAIISSTEESVKTKILVPQDLETGVYPFRIKFETNTGAQFIPNLYGRYASGGIMVQISNIEIPETEIIKAVSVDVANLITDTVRQDRRDPVDINIDVKVYGKNNKLLANGVSTGVTVDTFNKVSVDLGKNLEKNSIEKIEVLVTNAGKELDSSIKYFSVSEETKTNINTVIFTTLGLILIGLIIFFIKKKKTAMTGMSIIFAGLVVSGSIFAQGTINNESTHFQYVADSDPSWQDIDAVSWPSFRADNAINLVLNSPDQTQCYAPGQIIPLSIDVSYGLLNAVPATATIGGDTVPQTETFDVKVQALDYWWVDTQDSSDFSYVEAANRLAIAEAGNSDSTTDPLNLNTDYQPSQSYHALTINDVTGIANHTESSTNGSGDINFALVMPEEPGTHKLFVTINASHTQGDSDFVGSFDVDVCSSTLHDACAFIPGNQYIDGAGDLRDEDGTLMDYLVQIYDDFSVDALGGDGIEESENAFISVCNYCPKIQDPTATDAWWNKLKNLWVPFDANIPGATSNQIATYFDKANNLSAQKGEKDIHTRVSGFWWGPEAQYIWNSARKELNTYLNIAEEDDYQDDLIVHESGGNMFFMDIGKTRQGISHTPTSGATRLTHNYNIDSYTLQEMMDAIWADAGAGNIFDDWSNARFFNYMGGNDAGLIDGNHSDTFIFKEKEYDDIGGGPSHCVLYEDVCPSNTGIQFTKYIDNYPSTSYVELYTRVPGGPHTYHGQVEDSNANTTTLCALLPPPSSNDCPGIPGWTFNSSTNEVFDGTSTLVPYYTYTSDGQCRALCSNVSNWTFEESSRSVYNDTNTLETTYLGLPTTITSSGGLCVAQCPNLSGTRSYNQVDNLVYDDLTENQDLSLSYDSGSNSCISTDVCANISGTQWVVQGSSDPAQATDGTTTYSIGVGGECYVPQGNLSCTPNNNPATLNNGSTVVQFTAAPSVSGDEFYWPTGWSSNTTYNNIYTSEGDKEFLVRRKSGGSEIDHTMCQVHIDPDPSFSVSCVANPVWIGTADTTLLTATVQGASGSSISYEWFDPSMNSIGTGNTETVGPHGAPSPASYTYTINATRDSDSAFATNTCNVTVDDNPPALPPVINDYYLEPDIVEGGGQCGVYLDASNVSECSVGVNTFTADPSNNVIITGTSGVVSGSYKASCTGLDLSIIETEPKRCVGGVEVIEE